MPAPWIKRRRRLAAAEATTVVPKAAIPAAAKKVAPVVKKAVTKETVAPPVTETKVAVERPSAAAEGRLLKLRSNRGLSSHDSRVFAGRK
jgi:hypothetical protein